MHFTREPKSCQANSSYSLKIHDTHKPRSRAETCLEEVDLEIMDNLTSKEKIELKSLYHALAKLS